VIFVLDSEDVHRMPEAIRELQALLNVEELKACPILVLANKQDRPQALPLSEILDQLYFLHECQRVWHLQGTVAITGEGLTAGLEWLSNVLPVR
jgi:signal recognition particle receptor subunit beta